MTPRGAPALDSWTAKQRPKAPSFEQRATPLVMTWPLPAELQPSAPLAQQARCVFQLTCRPHGVNATVEHLSCSQQHRRLTGIVCNNVRSGLVIHVSSQWSHRLEFAMTPYVKLEQMPCRQLIHNVQPRMLMPCGPCPVTPYVCLAEAYARLLASRRFRTGSNSSAGGARASSSGQLATNGTAV